LAFVSLCSRHLLLLVLSHLLNFPLVLIRFPVFFFLNHPTTTEIYTLSLHDALPISFIHRRIAFDEIVDFIGRLVLINRMGKYCRSEEHTSELQSRFDLVCRLLLEKKKKIKRNALLPIAPLKHSLVK